MDMGAIILIVMMEYIPIMGNKLVVMMRNFKERRNNKTKTQETNIIKIWEKIIKAVQFLTFAVEAKCFTSIRMMNVFCFKILEKYLLIYVTEDFLKYPQIYKLTLQICHIQMKVFLW